MSATKTVVAKKTATTVKQNTKRTLEGVVSSDKMDKTIVVEVAKIKVHPKYNKRYKSSTKYQVHDEKNQFKIGDKVKFIECRPLSKNKRWRVLVNKSV